MKDAYRNIMMGTYTMDGGNNGMFTSNENQRRTMLAGAYTMDGTAGEISLKPISEGAPKSETKSMFNKEKWLPLVYLPIRISHKCCGVMKKDVLKGYQREHGVVPMVGTLADESRIRRQGWIRTGCNAFDGAKSKSQPLSFWTEQDILAYLVMFGLSIASVYGDIEVVDKSGLTYPALPEMLEFGGKLKTSGVDRTGCIFCAFGMHLEKGETRFQRIKRTHPKQYDYCIGGGQWIDNPDYIEDCPEYDGIWKNWNPEKIWIPSKEGLGFGKVFDMVNEIYGDDFYRYK